VPGQETDRLSQEEEGHAKKTSNIGDRKANGNGQEKPAKGHGCYKDCEELRKLLAKGKYVLDCGHLVTFSHNLSNNVVVINDGEIRIICTSCYD